MENKIFEKELELIRLTTENRKKNAEIMQLKEKDVSLTETLEAQEKS